MTTPAQRPPKDRPHILVIPPLAWLVAILAALALERWLPLDFLPPFPWVPGITIGVPILLASVLVNVSGARAFMAAKTPINPLKPVRTVVRGGAFRFTRNPMYLGMVGSVLGIAPAFSVDWAIPAAALLWAALHWGAVLREERYMAAKFGAPYAELLARTRRWL